MKKSQIIAIAVGIVAIGILYSLPRVVVDNDEGQNQVATSEEEVAETAPSHMGAIDESTADELATLRGKLSAADNKENFVTFADAISEIYSELGKYDSAAHYQELALDKSNNIERQERTGNAYYEAYTFALNEQKISFLAEKTRKYLNQVLDKDPSRLDLKTKVAMTYVSSSNPMHGITMLREVLEADASNEDALFNMGVLSMQSGQYKRAAERFEELIKFHPSNLQGQFYLAVSYYESKQNNKAKKQFEQVKSMTTDPQVLSSVDSYLERL
ncbi:tetratricopeptide repeat protein [Belliella sp. DSM 111904]|uniref:Tetratricopeptide repeat protein n=1 Tax=Belliella filtrata TaxID=2923435 RepID=A0ABS9UUV7_9BACT|nr:tetratricopeptide repeat protein [Belliella filtrata]MCH7407818.1 tetratricopeptide repeat protein [Belliella filtrata]